MLILRRKPGESFRVGGNVTITVLSSKDNEVQIAIDAPKEVAVLRSELYNAMNENRDAAAEQSQPQELLALLSHMQQKEPGEKPDGDNQKRGGK